jgi:predicted PurR-regulated permease PerM
MEPNSGADSKLGRKVFAAIVALLFCYVSSPLWMPVTMGAVLATLFIPWLEHLEKRKFPTGIASLLLTLVITLFFVLPTSLITFIGTRETLTQLQAFRANQLALPTQVESGGWAGAFVSLPKVHAILERITEWIPIQLQDVVNTAQDLTRSGVARLAELLGGVATQLPGVALAVAIMMVSVFFFLRDGRRLVLFVRHNSVFSVPQTNQLLRTLGGTCRSVILATVVSGAAQATMEFVMCAILQVPNAALIGILVFLGSFVPVVGSAPITLGVVLHQLIMDHTTNSIVLLITAIIVMLLDNFIRPIILHGTANLHPLLAFVAAFGGLQTMGFTGVFLGPIIAAMFVATIQVLTHPEAKPHSPLVSPDPKLIKDP